MSNEVFFKPSLNLDSFFGDEFFEDNERFLLFLKAYYEWLQTTRVVFTNKTGTFQRGEQVVGATSKATGIIKEVKIDSLVIQVNTKKAFAKSETITGQTSTATATIYSVKDNVVRASGNVVDYRNLENSIDKYFEYLKDELYTSLPIDFYGNKPLIASKFKDFFTSKSNEQSYRFLFRLLYNEEIDFYYPGDDIIRSSDGNFEKTQVIRTTAVGFGIDNAGAQYERNIFDFLNKTIRGQTSGALAFVVDIKKFFIGSLETAEMTLRLVSADFDAGEEIVDIDDEDLNATVYGIVAGVTINDGGSGYQVGDAITISGDGSEAQAIVSSIRQSPITALKVNTVGHGYRLGTTASINNAGTGGTGLIVRVTELANTYTVTNANTGNTYTVGEVSEVSVINRGSGYFASPTITLIDSTIESLGLLSDKLVTIVNPGTNYHVGDSLVITANTGANAVGQIASVTANATYSNTLLFEDGFELLFEQSYDDVAKTEDWDVGSYGPIARVEFTNFGDGYIAADPPTITVSTSSGANASLTVVGVQGMNANVEVDTANNLTGIGSIRAVEISNFGIDYSTATANASSVGDGNANLTPIISGIGESVGNWLDDDGKLSFKILQDSYYYQDYSYVIKSGLTVEKYLDVIKKSIHPAGLQVFGEILLIDNITVTPQFRSAIETIKDFIVRIYDFVSAEAAFGGFDITIETTIESFAALQVALIPNTDIVNQQYVVQFTQNNINDNTISTYREIVVNVESDFDTESTPIPYEVTKFVLGFTKIFDAYTETEYGDLKILPYADSKLSEFSTRTFGERFGEIPNIFNNYIVKLVPGGGDETIVENLNVQTFRQHNFILELYWDASTSVLISDIQTEQTGTREVIVDKITFVDVESSHNLTEIVNQYKFDLMNVESSTDKKYSLLIESSNFANVEIQTIISFASMISDTVLTLYSSGVAEVQIIPEFISKYNFDQLNVEISTDKEFSILVNSLGFANSEFTMIVAESSITPQKQQTTESLMYLYGTEFGDLVISDIANFTFEDDVVEKLVSMGYTYGSRRFNSLYNITPRTESEYVVISQSVANDIITIDYTLEFNIQTLSSVIPQTDNEMTLVVFEQKPYYDTLTYDSLPVEFYQNLTLAEFENYVLGDVLQNQILENYIAKDLSVNKYQKTAGTVSYAGTEEFANGTLETYQSTILDVFDYKSLGASIGTWTGTGTNFTSDFANNEQFLVGSELFKVYAVSNNTHMISDRPSENSYSNVFIYKSI